jgi:signal transduction histidine kinase
VPLIAKRMALATALVAAGLTAVVTFVPSVRFAYRSPTAHVALETAAGLMAALAAYLVLARFGRRRRRTELLLTAALLALAASNLLFAVLPQIEAGMESRFGTWTALLGSTLGTALFAAAAVLPDRALVPHRRETLLVAGGTVAALGLVVAVVLVLGDRLPLAVDPDLSPELSSHPRVIGDPAVLVFIGLSALALTAAAIGFARTAERRSDELLAWLAVAAVLGVLSRLNYFMFPSRYSEWITTGDMLRLAFYGALFIGALREIAGYQPSLARAAVLDERRRLARDLHDGLSQELAFIGAQARTLLDRRGDDVELAHIAEAADRAIDESRLAIAALSRPADQPLPRALADVANELAARSGSTLELELADEADADEQTRETLVRILREAMTNAVRHARPSRIAVRLEDGRELRLSVADDGAGFDPAAPGAGFGLVSMRERAEALGGSLAVASVPGGGTTVEVVVPR